MVYQITSRLRSAYLTFFLIFYLCLQCYAQENWSWRKDSLAYTKDSIQTLNRKGVNILSAAQAQSISTPELLGLYRYLLFQVPLEQAFVQNVVQAVKLEGCMMASKHSNSLHFEKAYQRAIAISNKTIGNTQDGITQEHTLWENAREQLDSLFLTYGKINCTFLKTYFSKRLAKKPSKLDQVKQAYSYLQAHGCAKDSFFMVLARQIIEAEPSFGGLRRQSQWALQEKKPEQALVWLQKAIPLARTTEQKVDVAWTMAQIYEQQKQWPKAKVLLLEILQKQPEHKPAHALLGDMYVQSTSTCQEGNIVQQKAVYIAAYLHYEKAGELDKMKSSKAQFPLLEEVFSLGLKKGQMISIGCWIQEQVPLQYRE